MFSILVTADIRIRIHWGIVQIQIERPRITCIIPIPAEVA